MARDPGVRLRDLAATLGITERTAFGVVADLTDAGYVIKKRDGRRNRYEIQHHLPLAEPTSQERRALCFVPFDRRVDVTGG
jgi:DNA-binding IclR family transcriptional regulator